MTEMSQEKRKVLLHASQKDYNDIARQVKLFYYTANKLKGIFAQCSTEAKNISILCLLHANACLLPIMEQIHAAWYCLCIAHTGVLNLFKHVAQLINKQRIYGPPTTELL